MVSWFRFGARGMGSDGFRWELKVKREAQRYVLAGSYRAFIANSSGALTASLSETPAASRDSSRLGSIGDW